MLPSHSHDPSGWVESCMSCLGEKNNRVSPAEVIADQQPSSMAWAWCRIYKGKKRHLHNWQNLPYPKFSIWCLIWCLQWDFHQICRKRKHGEDEAINSRHLKLIKSNSGGNCSSANKASLVKFLEVLGKGCKWTEQDLSRKEVQNWCNNGRSQSTLEEACCILSLQHSGYKAVVISEEDTDILAQCLGFNKNKMWNAKQTRFWHDQAGQSLGSSLIIWLACMPYRLR